MRLPRDVSGSRLAAALAVLGYTVTRQTGSHIRLTTVQNGDHHAAITRSSCGHHTGLKPRATITKPAFAG